MQKGNPKNIQSLADLGKAGIKEIFKQNGYFVDAQKGAKYWQGAQ